jgi:hypothetical protein
MLESMELQADGVGCEGAACRAFAFFDVLLATLVVDSKRRALPGLVRLVTMKPTRGQSSPALYIAFEIAKVHGGPPPMKADFTFPMPLAATDRARLKTGGCSWPDRGMSI